MRIIRLLLLLSLFILYPALNVLSAQSQNVYYGYVPLKVGYPTAKLYIIGDHDDTKVQVFSLPDLKLIVDFKINKMEEKILEFSNGSFFKIVSDKAVTVILAGGSEVSKGIRSITTFFTSVNGGYVGREFIFRSFVRGEGPGAFTVYAIEDSEIKIYDSSGSQVMNFKVPLGGFKDFNLKPFEVYRLVSTGRVMFQSFAQKAPGSWGGITRWSSYAIPSPEGSFMGRYFYVRGAFPGPYKVYTDYILTSNQRSAVNIYNLDAGAILKREEIPETGNLTFKSLKVHLFFQSEKPATLMIFANDGGLIVFGLKKGQTTQICIPSEEAYALSSKDAVLILDGAKYSLSKDEPFKLPSGTHEISAQENIIILMVDYGSIMSLPSFGSCLPSIQTLSIEYPNLKVTPPRAEFPWLTVIGAVATIAVVAAVLILLRRMRR